MSNHTVLVPATQWGITDLYEGITRLAAEISGEPVTWHSNYPSSSISVSSKGNEVPQYYSALPEQHIPLQTLLS